jgi:hypothetical protein
MQSFNVFPYTYKTISNLNLTLIANHNVKIFQPAQEDIHSRREGEVKMTALLTRKRTIKPHIYITVEK